MAQITTTDYKLYRQISGTDSTRDTRIGVLIAAVEAFAERYLGRSFDSATVTAEDHDWNSAGVYWLRRTPVTSFTSVSLVDAQGNVTALAASSYRYDASTGEFRLYDGGVALNAALWLVGGDLTASGFRAVRFAYVGGATVSADLKLALLQMVDDLYTSNEFGQGVNQRLSGGSLGDVSYSFKSEEEMRLLARRYLLPFKSGGVQ